MFGIGDGVRPVLAPTPPVFRRRRRDLLPKHLDQLHRRLGPDELPRPPVQALRDTVALAPRQSDNAAPTPGGRRGGDGGREDGRGRRAVGRVSRGKGQSHRTRRNGRFPAARPSVRAAAVGGAFASFVLRHEGGGGEGEDHAQIGNRPAGFRGFGVDVVAFSDDFFGQTIFFLGRNGKVTDRILVYVILADTIVVDGRQGFDLQNGSLESFH
mmetsp:Transcript_37039/g.86435  ORF Transcript_37039/g.86435 Transcript_37039/m.86435 type:complete len:212 (+) Transcript_37039:152-787(+)